MENQKLTTFQEMVLCDYCKTKFFGIEDKPIFGKGCPHYNCCVRVKLIELVKQNANETHETRKR